MCFVCDFYASKKQKQCVLQSWFDLVCFLKFNKENDYEKNKRI